jgi:hypothetical protein
MKALFVLGIDHAGTNSRAATFAEKAVQPDHTEVLTKLVNIQRPHSSVQSNKPWLQSRWPSAPNGRFKTFLLPPAAIGAVFYIFNTEAEYS